MSRASNRASPVVAAAADICDYAAVVCIKPLPRDKIRVARIWSAYRIQWISSCTDLFSVERAVTIGISNGRVGTLGLLGEVVGPVVVADAYEEVSIADLVVSALLGAVHPDNACSHWPKQRSTLTVIHRKHRFIYMKSGKTAGTAVEAHLLTQTRLGNDIWNTAADIRKHGIPQYRKHVVLGSIAEHLVAIPDCVTSLLWHPSRLRVLEHHGAKSLSKRLGDFWNTALKATSVRNPWDIMVSAWSWRRDGKGGMASPITATFDEWVSASLSRDAEWQRKVEAFDAHRLMHPFLFMDGRLAVDLVIRQERINDGLQEIANRLDISVPPITVREKASNRKRDFRSYYTDELAQSVGDYFADIISLFDYRFDPEEEDPPRSRP